ncbi:hypothetical protein AB0D59_10150 [Streptomyces sp. NPDC048417]|uniref:hypothetical protein n=1 Tax=Streptomyces sp. NPDC048417 TaxID=3155387 RepID=UPI00343B2A6D
MADEQDKWLNRVTAERLLRGESLEAVDESARDQAERLARTLGALSVGTASATVELPGEEAALAAFRKARESAGDEWTSVARQPARFGRGSDAGLIRIGAGPRPPRVPAWARPARFALAAALTAGMLGGVAVAAGTGVLPTPFGDDRPAPGASVSAAGTPVRPQGSPSTESLLGGETGAPSAGATSRAPVQPSPDPSGKPKDRETGSRGTSGNGWSRALAFCRDIQDGKSLGADRRRALEGLAGGAGRVNKFCKVLIGAGAGGKNGVSDDGKGDGKGDGNGQGGQNSGPGGGDSGSGGGQGGDDDGQPGRSGGGGRGHHRQDGVAASPTAFAPLLPNRADPSPDPTYSAL